MEMMDVLVLVAAGYLALVVAISGQFWWDYWMRLTPEERRRERKQYFEEHELY